MWALITGAFTFACIVALIIAGVMFVRIIIHKLWGK
jgi:hypothetical protein